MIQGWCSKSEQSETGGDGCEDWINKNSTKYKLSTMWQGRRDSGEALRSKTEQSETGGDGCDRL